MAHKSTRQLIKHEERTENLGEELIVPIYSKSREKITVCWAMVEILVSIPSRDVLSLILGSNCFPHGVLSVFALETGVFRNQ